MTIIPTPIGLTAEWGRTSVALSWGMEGTPAAQLLHWRKVANPAVSWTTEELSGGIRKATIVSMAAGTEYEVQIRAVGGHEDTIVGKTLSIPRPTNTVPPVITGTPQEGQTLHASAGTWTNEPTAYHYQWLLNGVAIPGATASSYKLTAADV